MRSFQFLGSDWPLWPPLAWCCLSQATGTNTRTLSKRDQQSINWWDHRLGSSLSDSLPDKAKLHSNIFSFVLYINWIPCVNSELQDEWPLDKFYKSSPGWARLSSSSLVLVPWNYFANLSIILYFAILLFIVTVCILTLLAVLVINQYVSSEGYNSLKISRSYKISSLKYCFQMILFRKVSSLEVLQI